MYKVTPFMSKLQMITTKIILSTDRQIDRCFIVLIPCSHRLNYERHYNKDITIKKKYIKYNNKKVKSIKLLL